MSVSVSDYQQILEDAVAEAKATGHRDAAAKLEARAFAAFTTSSELLGEQGLAILEFLKSEDQPIQGSVRKKLEMCLTEIRKVWPGL